MPSDKEIIQMLRVLDSTCKPESIEWVARIAADRLEKTVNGYSLCMDRLVKWCAMYPSAGLEPKKSARNENSDYPSLFKCSGCGFEDDDTTSGDLKEYKYCPSCGRKIESEETPVDAALIGAAKWIDKTFTIQCSACGNEFDDEVTCTDVDGWPWEYCPKCGVKMEVQNAE